MSRIVSETKQDEPGVLRVLRTKDEARAFYNKIARVYAFLSESSEELAVWELRSST